MSEHQNILFVEKYRPKTLEDLIGQDIGIIKDLMKDPSAMPHLLFMSRSPGTGKTSLAKVIKNTIGCPDQDYLVLNSSADRKIETIRERIKPFVQTLRSNDNIPRIIHMDEFDGVPGLVQDALRNLMESNSKNCKFILTANDETKIDAAIKSRCVTIRFSEPPKDAIFNRLRYICEQEHIKHDLQAINKIVEMYYPDMRRMINKIQELSSVGITMDTFKKATELDDTLYTMLKNTRNLFECRKFFIENNMDPEISMKYIMSTSLSDIDLKQVFKDDMSKWKTMIRQLIETTAELNYRLVVGADKEIQMLAFMVKYLEVVPRVVVEPKLI